MQQHSLHKFYQLSNNIFEPDIQQFDQRNNKQHQ